MAITSLVLLIGAIQADAGWLDRHFLPEYRGQQHLLAILSALRVALILSALTLLLVVRPAVLRRVASGAGPKIVADSLRVALAAGLALGTCELLLRLSPARATQESPADKEPLARRDARLGWVPVPAHVGHGLFEWRSVDYIADPAGYRVRAAGVAVDPALPTMLFTGESFMYGYRLDWQDSLPAQMESLTGVQSANLAVNGYANDQAYLRLRQELPRFLRPVAVVSLFLPRVFVRNLDQDRPHLDADLRWWPAQTPLRLEALATRLVRYHSLEAIDRGVAMASAVLRATDDLARSRDAKALIVVPQFGAETAAERRIRQRVLDDAHLPYVQVALDPNWQFAHDMHPDARAAHAMALAVAAGLRREPP